MRIFGSVIWILFSAFIIVGGVVGCFTPLETLASFAILLPILLLIGGISECVYYFRIKNFNGSRILLLDGILSLLFAIIFFVSGVEFTSITLVYFVAFIVMFRGILALSYAFDMRTAQISSWGWILLFGILNILISMIFVIFPQIGGITIGIMISVLIILFGIALLLGWWSVLKIFR